MPDQLRLDIQITGADQGAASIQRVVDAAQAAGASFKVTATNADSLASAVTRTGTAHATAATQTATLDSALLRLGTSINPLPGQFNALSNAALSVGGITPVMAGVTLGVGALAAGMAAAVTQAMEFQRVMGSLNAVLPVADVQKYGGALGDLAMKLGRDTVFSAGEAAAGLQALARQGVATQDILNGVGLAATNMAGAMGTTPEHAALALGAAMREFNLQGSDAAHVADLFAQAVHVAGLNAEGLSVGISRLAPVVNALGGNLQDTVTGMELLARSGVSASRAGSMLAQFYEDAANPRNKAAAAMMRELGIITEEGGNKFLTAEGNIRPFPELVKVAADSVQGLSRAQVLQVAQTEESRRAMEALLIMVNAYRTGGLDQLTSAQENARTAAEAMNARLDNLWGSTKQLTSSVQTLAIAFGNDLSPGLRSIVDGAKDATNELIKMHEYAASHPVGEMQQVGGINITAGANLTQLFPRESLQTQLANSIAAEFAPSLADSMVNGLQEQRMGERLAGWASQWSRELGVTAGGEMAAGLAEGVSTKTPRSLEDMAGALLAEFKGNAAAAIKEGVAELTDSFGQVSGAAGPLIQQIETQANAAKALTEALNTLTPAERAHWQLMLQETNASAVLNAMREQGAITEEEYTNALERGTMGLLKKEAAHKAVQSALQEHNEALQKAAGSTDEATAANARATIALDKLIESEGKRFGGDFEGRLQALIAQNKETQAAAEVEDRLGVAHGTLAAAANGAALAEQTLSDAQTRAKEAALGGAVAIRDHTEALARQHEAALGGAIAIRDHEEALQREKEAHLGGAVAIRDHAEALTRQHEAALGGAIAIRDHEDALAREKETALGGAVAIRDHAEALTREHEQALGGALAIRSHQEELEREKVAALGGYEAIYQHDQELAREKNFAQDAATATAKHAAALTDLKNTADQITATLQQQTNGVIINTRAHDDYYKLLNPSIEATKAFVTALLAEADAFDKAGKAEEAAATRRGALQFAQQPRSPFERAVIDATPGGNSATPALIRGTVAAAIPPPEETAAQAQPVGTAIDDGMAQGVYDNKGAVIGAMQGIVDEAIAATKERLGIASPSTVAAQQIGLPIAQGVGQGFAAGMQSTIDGIKKYVGIDLVEAAKDAMGVGSPLPQDIEAYWQGVWNGIEKATVAGQAHLKAIAEGRDRAPHGIADWGEFGGGGEMGLVDDLNRIKVIGGDASTAVQGLGAAVTGVGTAASGSGATFQRMGNVLVQSFSEPLRFAQGLATAMVDVGTESAQAAAQAEQAWGAALRANQTIVAGINTGTGLTYGQIYGGTATQGAGGTGSTNMQTTTGGQGIQRLAPGTYNGLPVVSPLTGGTLYGFAGGGMVYEPSYIVPARTGVPAAIMAENGPEPVGWGGGSGGTIQVNIYASGVDALRDRTFWEQAVDKQVRPVLQKRGYL